jgi:predicted polyphosphate/ATP-dependent NAD kinase
MHRIGFLINPIAGMGGRVGLKGTDDVVEEARRRGAEPSAHLRAAETLAAIRRLCAQASPPPGIRWLTCAGAMGAAALREAGFDAVDVVHEPAEPSDVEDTRSAVRRLRDEGVELILFCGGDGTARDICAITGQETPILGIPAGVKMYSGVFGTTPRRTAEILLSFLRGRLEAAPADVLDLDEARYRRGEWAVKLYHAALTPYEPVYTQSAKLLITEASDAEVKQEIAEFLRDEIEKDPGRLYLLGPGSTVQALGRALGRDKTLLGIDALLAGRIVGRDLNEEQILQLLDRHADATLILSPIGAQGFVLGRGNLPLSAEVLRRIGRDNIVVVATPAKLARTPLLRFDTGDPALDAELAGPGYLSVVVGDGRRRMVKVAV